MIELRYFTGTGNSKRLLQCCQNVFESQGRAARMASIAKPVPLAEGAEVLGLGFPVYALGIPRIVRRYLQELPAAVKDVKAFVLAAIGAVNEEGWALQEATNLLAAKGFRVVLADAVLTPDNWMPMSYVPSPEEAAAILKASDRQAEAAARQILAGHTYVKPFVMPKYGPFWSRVMHAMFHRRGIYELWRLFKTTPACNGCGVCARACPMAAIRLENHRPRWSPACEQCMRCMNYCPQKAIRQLEFVGHGSRRHQYHEPHFNPIQELRGE